jgi:hypothetical protein
MIYSEAFDSLPPIVRDRIYRRLWEIVSGSDQTPAYARLTATDRTAVRDILLETKRDLPQHWRKAITGIHPAL